MPPPRKNPVELQRGRADIESIPRGRRHPTVVQLETKIRRTKRERGREIHEEAAGQRLEAAPRFDKEARKQQLEDMAREREEASIQRRRPQAIPRHGPSDDGRMNKVADASTTRTTTKKAHISNISNISSNTHRDRVQKRKSDIHFNDATELSNDKEQTCPPAKRVKPSVKPHGLSTSVHVPRPADKGNRGRQAAITMATETGMGLGVVSDPRTITKRPNPASASYCVGAESYPELSGPPAKKAKTRKPAATQKVKTTQAPRWTERRLEFERSNVVDQYPQDVYSSDSEDEAAQADAEAYAILCQDFSANGRSSEDEEELWAKGQSSPSTMDEGDADTGDSELERTNDVESKRNEKRRPVSTANRKQSTATAGHVKRALISSQRPKSLNDHRLATSSSNAPVSRAFRASRTTSGFNSSRSRMTALNEVAVTQKSLRKIDVPSARSKVKTRIIQESDVDRDEDSDLDSDDDIQPAIGGLPSDEDDSLERAAALSSNLMGWEARKLAEGMIKVVHHGRLGQDLHHVQVPYKPPLPYNIDVEFKDIILPYWIQFRMAQGDPWSKPNHEDLVFVKKIWHRAFGTSPPYEIKNDAEVYKKLGKRLNEYRSRMKKRAEQVVFERINIMYENDTDGMKDRAKRIAFGAYFCHETKEDSKFIWQGYDKPGVPGTRTGKFLGFSVVDTFSVHFKFSQPTRMLENVSIGYPIGGLALAISALERAFVLYRDDHLEYKDGRLSIKKLLAEVTGKGMEKEPVSGEQNQERKEEVRNTKHDFRSSNSQGTTKAWLEAIKENIDDVFPEVCNRASKAAHRTITNVHNVMWRTSDRMNGRAFFMESSDWDSDTEIEDCEENTPGSENEIDPRLGNIHRCRTNGDDGGTVDGSNAFAGTQDNDGINDANIADSMGTDYDKSDLGGGVDEPVAGAGGDGASFVEEKPIGKAWRRRSARLAKH